MWLLPLHCIVKHSRKGNQETFAAHARCKTVTQSLSCKVQVSSGQNLFHWHLALVNLACDQGKVSRQDIAELCVELLSQHEMLDKTFEVKSTTPFSQPFEVDQTNPPKDRDWQARSQGSNFALTPVLPSVHFFRSSITGI